jgi:hypothetical protein
MNKKLIEDKIYSIRGFQVLLDDDLADLYGVEIRRLNEQVKRNIERFPRNFMFQLTSSEYDFLRSQIATLESGRGKHRKYNPFVFTEQGVAMLSGVLRSETAVKVSIQIINAFVVMRKFISKNTEMLYKLSSVEQRQFDFEIKTDKKFEIIFKAIEDKTISKKQGVFFDGQIFDAYHFVSNLIRNAKKSIILIDNYIDDSVLTMLAKKNKDVNVIIYTKNITRIIELDLIKFNLQYPFVQIKQFTNSHDRFMIIDDEDVYHFGASLKDLGKKWFAFSKFDKEVFRILDKLK